MTTEIREDKDESSWRGGNNATEWKLTWRNSSKDHKTICLLDRIYNIWPDSGLCGDPRCYAGGMT